MEETQYATKTKRLRNNVTAKGDFMIKVPGNLSDEEAATLGGGIAT